MTASQGHVLGALSILAIALSAWLLFTVELLSGRMVLPVYGGSPSVWTTALCFFTGTVFAGYGYAHVVARLRVGRSVHALLVSTVAALGVGTFAIAPESTRMDGVPDVLAVLASLTALVGLPAFVLGSTTPLLSAWYQQRGRDPWFLYAISNAASLAALLGYPFIVEPALPISIQRLVIALGTILFAVLIAVLVASQRRWLPEDRDLAGAEAARTGRSPAPRAVHRLRWLLGAAIPAGLLAAVTNLLTTDLASAPLLWIGPLAIYLGSFVVAFSDRGRRLLPAVDRLVPAATILLWATWTLRTNWPLPVTLVVVGGAFAVVATAIHGRLALDRPHADRLTGFYLTTSAGGLLATTFVAVLAPLLFSTIAEFPILLIAGLFIRAWLPDPSRTAGALLEMGRRTLPFVALSVAVIAIVAARSPDVLVVTVVLLGVGGLVIAGSTRPATFAIGATALVAIIAVVSAPDVLVRERTFFGVIEVRETADGMGHAEFSGTTLHGLQYLDAARRTEPTSYYVPSGPMGDVMADLRSRTTNGATIGVIGLGVATISVYGEPGDHITYVEIDEAVARIALDTRYFTNLANSTAKETIVLGDGRRVMENGQTGQVDLLIIDAFSSDVVPVHLLTAEAMTIYRGRLTSGGVIVFHLSNRYYDLPPAVAATARSIGLDALERSYRPSPVEVVRLGGQASSWLVVGDQTAIAGFETAGWRDVVNGPVLTDDYADLIGLLRAFR